jgi:hypothetical protein
MVARDCFGISMGMDCPPTGLTREAAYAVAHEGAIDARTGHVDRMIAGPIPGDSLRTKTTGLPEVKYPPDGLLREPF